MWAKTSFVLGIIGFDVMILFLVSNEIEPILTWIPENFLLASIIFISFTTSSLAIYFGILGLNQIRKKESRGEVVACKGMCVAGTTLGAIGIAFWLWILCSFFV